MVTLRARHCRRLSIHAEHRYKRDVPVKGLSQVTSDITYVCPGVLHDHAIYCCAEHDHHVSPHVGCVLR